MLDDLHWADRPTLQLLGHLVRAPAPERVLFLATTRADEGSEALAALLAGLRRDGVLERVELTGLDALETGALVAALGGRPSTPSFVDELHGETEGNPFFIEEVVHHLADADGHLGGAVALHEAGRARRACARSRAGGWRGWASRRGGMLATAAVIGREFEFDVLEEVGPLRGDELVAALEEAVAARRAARGRRARRALRVQPRAGARDALRRALGAAPRAPAQPRRARR